MSREREREIWTYNAISQKREWQSGCVYKSELVYSLSNTSVITKKAKKRALHTHTEQQRVTFDVKVLHFTCRITSLYICATILPLSNAPGEMCARR